MLLKVQIRGCCSLIITTKREGEVEEEEDQVNMPRVAIFSFQLSLMGGPGQLVMSSNHLTITVSVFRHCQFFGSVSFPTFCKVAIFC